MGYDKKALKTSPNIATVGRDLLVSSKGWVGQRPGKVVTMGVGEGPEQRVNVNVQFDGTRDKKQLANVRSRVCGNTWAGVPVFDPLDPAQRDEAIKTFGTIAEWPRIGSATIESLGIETQPCR